MWPAWGYYIRICLEGLRKPIKTLLQNSNHSVLEYARGVVLQHGDKKIY
jgi:hypothetical protein